VQDHTLSAVLHDRFCTVEEYYALQHLKLRWHVLTFIGQHRGGCVLAEPALPTLFSKLFCADMDFATAPTVLGVKAALAVRGKAPNRITDPSAEECPLDQTNALMLLCNHKIMPGPT